MTIEELTASVEYHLKRLRELGYTDESLIPTLWALFAYYVEQKAKQSDNGQ